MKNINPIQYEHFPHTVTIDNDLLLKGDIADWLEVNVGHHGDTYMGPIFNIDLMVFQYYFQNLDNATLFKLTWFDPAKVRRCIIDPPSGWRYGFPREIPDSELHRINEWLVENRYPQREIDAFGGDLPYKIWIE